MKQFAGTLVIKNGQVLLVQESHTSAKGLWSLPIGSVDAGESLIEATIRETKEETSYDVKVPRRQTISMSGKELKTLRQFHAEQVTLTIFMAEIVSGNLSAGEDLLDAKWHRLDKLDVLQLRGNWVKDFAHNKFYLKKHH